MHYTSTLPREQAHAILDRILDVAERVGRPTESNYSQRDAERPAGCGRERYLRVHRLAFDARDPGATKIGRARLLTADAWLRWAASLPSRTRPKPPAPLTLDEQLLAELGLERAS
jgi:hypothetical protein